VARGYPDFEGDKSGLYLKPEWAAYEGIDKNFRATGLNKATLTWASFSYDVPAGKTLYICGASMWIRGYAVEDRDNNQIGALDLQNFTTATHLVMVGGNGGCSVVLPKPLVIPGDDKFYGAFFNKSNHSCNIEGTAWGYEI